ncbi:MAG: sigma-54 dependent transcriptional regulator [Nitrospiraceae bacterium]|nr:sigma-54 dependent transcriptional regulator [Nitrospiraceae bacterium]
MAKQKEKILVVEDERHMREILKMLLEQEGFDVLTAQDGAEGVRSLEKEIFNLVITDIKMPGVDGFGILKRALDISPETAVIMITAFGTMESTLEAMKMGAYGYVHKPFKIDEIRLMVKKALDKQKMQRQLSLLRQRAEAGPDESIVTRSQRMKDILRMLPRVAESRASVLITGESGTGKDMVANAIHNLGPRKEANFVAINCANLPEGLLESELFGYMKGAFTGAAQNKQGFFEVADKGTLFLDEIAEMPVQLQSKLLRVIETGTFRRLGSTTDITVETRIISATNRDLKEAVQKGTFREDLFYRLNAIPVHLPPLRERKEDIPALIEHFLKKRKKEKHFAKDAIEVLMGHSWRGNIRELENVIERILLFSDQDTIRVQDIPDEITGDCPCRQNELLSEELGEGFALEPLLEKLEKDYLFKALGQSGGRKAEAARLLGLSFRSFRHRLAKYDIK